LLQRQLDDFVIKLAGFEKRSVYFIKIRTSAHKGHDRACFHKKQASARVFALAVFLF